MVDEITEINAIFRITLDKKGCLELKTADLSHDSFQKIRGMIMHSKRVIISTRSGYGGTRLCTTVDDSYLSEDS